MRPAEGGLKFRDRQETPNSPAERQGERVVSRMIAMLGASSRGVVDHVPDSFLPHDPPGRQLIQRESERDRSPGGSADRHGEPAGPDPDLLVAAQAEQRELVYRTAQGIRRPLICGRQRLWKWKRQHFRFNTRLTKVQSQGVLHALGKSGEGKKRLGDIREMGHPRVHMPQCSEVGDAAGRGNGYLPLLKIQTGESNERVSVVRQRNDFLAGFVDVESRATVKRS